MSLPTSATPHPTAHATRLASLVEALRGDVALPAARVTLEDFGASSLRPALGELLDDPSALALTARRSYRHANGFVKVVLHASDDLKLRLHIAEGTAEENVHDHRWAFASTVLTGRLENDIFTDVPAGRGERFHEWEYLRAEEGAEKQLRGGAWIAQSLWQSVAAGQSYALAGSHLHRIRWTVPGTSTLVATFRPSRATTRLLSRTPDPPAVEIVPLSASDLAAVLRQYLGSTEQN